MRWTKFTAPARQINPRITRAVYSEFFSIKTLYFALILVLNYSLMFLLCTIVIFSITPFVFCRFCTPLKPILGAAPQTRLSFFIAKKTLRAAPCRPHPGGGLCKKASTPGRRPQDKFIFIRAFYNLFYQGLHPLPALLFFIAKKVSKKASPPGSHKIYFYTGILQLPTVGQVKCLYNSVKNKFYRRLQRGALNCNGTAKDKSEQQRQKLGGKKRFVLCRPC